MRDAAPRTPDAGEAVGAAFPITDRKGWVALLGIAVVFAGIVAWLAFGQLPQEVRGDAVIVPTDGFIDVGRDDDGPVTALYVAPGDSVQEGDVVARLAGASGPIDVTAPTTGTIANILERVGGSSDPGRPIMTMSSATTGERAVAFLPAGVGNTVKVGMPARVAIAEYPQAQFGTMTGTVVSVATLPVTTERLDVVMGGNDALVRYFVAQGPMIEVNVQLEPDPTSPSGYNWTIGTGPDQPIDVGSLGQVSVLIAEGSPFAGFVR